MIKQLEEIIPFIPGPDSGCKICHGSGYETFYVQVGEDDVDKDFRDCDCVNSRAIEHREMLKRLDAETDTILLLGDDECLK